MCDEGFISQEQQRKKVAKKLIPVLRKRLKNKKSEIRAESLLALAYLGRSKDFGLIKDRSERRQPHRRRGSCKRAEILSQIRDAAHFERTGKASRT